MESSMIMAKHFTKHTEVYHEDLSIFDGSMNHGDEKTIPFLR
jgi:hypothetical protein